MVLDYKSGNYASCLIYIAIIHNNYINIDKKALRASAHLKSSINVIHY